MKYMKLLNRHHSYQQRSKVWLAELNITLNSQIYRMGVVNQEIARGLLRLREGWVENQVKYLPEDLFETINKY